jgi:GAF domain-containing protein
MKVVQGSLFIVNENEEGQKYLELFSCYAYDKKKFVQKTINIGEGLVGQVYLEGEVAYMTKVPKNYVHITSGLGEATPRSIVIVPLKINNEVNGVIELASFNAFERHEIDFLKRIAESMASTVTAVKSAEHTQKLLKESQQMTLQMRLQEEAMRQQMEELQATQEEMERSRYND